MEATATLAYANSRFDELVAAAKEEWARPADPSLSGAGGWASKSFHENEGTIAAAEEARQREERSRDWRGLTRGVLLCFGLLTLGVWRTFNL